MINYLKTNVNQRYCYYFVDRTKYLSFCDILKHKEETPEEIENALQFKEKTENLIIKAEQNWNRNIVDGLLSVSGCFIDLFDNGTRAFEKVPDEVENGRISLTKKLNTLSSKRDEISGSPRLFLRRASQENAGRTFLTSSGTNSCRFDKGLSPKDDSSSSRNRARKLTGANRVSCSNLKDLQSLQNESCDEILELKQKNEALHQILNKVILREKFYKRRLNIIIDVILHS